MVLDSQKLSGAMGQAAREADGWENVLGNLSETWRQFKANVGAPVLENLVPIIQNITTALQGWINGVDWDAFTSDFNSFVNAVMENGDTIISIIAGIGAGFLAWNVTSIINGVIASVTALGGILPAISAGIKAINVAMKANVIGIVVTAIAALVTWLVTLYNTNDEFREKVNAAWAAVKTVVLNAVAAFENAVDKFFDKVVEIGNSVVSFFKSVPEQMVEIGKNIVRGLWEGIKAMASWIGEKVSGFVGGLVDGVKGVLGIHSPSRVFAGIGQNMALGLGQGFEKQMQSVTAGIQDAIPTPTVDTVYNAAAGMVNGLAAQSAGSPGGSYTINLILQNGQQIASWLLPDLRDAARSNPEVATA